MKENCKVRCGICGHEWTTTPASEFKCPQCENEIIVAAGYEQSLKCRIAHEYCNSTFTSLENIEQMSDEAAIHNLRFMAFCAGWDACTKAGLTTEGE